MVPPGAFIEVQSCEVKDNSHEEFRFHVSCDFVRLSEVQQLLQNMPLRKLSEKEGEDVLDLLDKLGILVWINEADLRDLVMLNPRRMAVAMAKLMTICFGVNNFEHQDVGQTEDIKFIRQFESDAKKDPGESADLQRFRSTGIATQDLISRIWKKDG